MSSFDDRAREWDTLERRDRARKAAALIRAHVHLDPSMRAIDLGAGTGLLGLELAADVGSVVLAEPSAGMLEVARAKLAAGPANVSAVRFDLPADPPSEAPFDLAVSLMVLHHVADTDAALRSIQALLAPDGWLALLDLDAEDGSFHAPGAEGIHHQGFEPDLIVRLAAAAGFVDLETLPAFDVEREGRTYPLFLLVGRRP